MNSYTGIIKEYPKVSFSYKKGNIEIFYNKQIHSYYEIYLFLNGNAEFLNDHTRRKLEINDLVIIPPGKYHRFIAASEDIDNYERCVINIQLDFLKDTALEEALNSKELLTLSPYDRIVENFMYLKNSMNQNDDSDFEYILSAIVTDIIFLIKKSSDYLTNVTDGFIHPISVKIMEYVNQNYKSSITLKDIADHFSFSISSVSHIFKDNFGVSIKKYINEKRMNEIYMHLQKGEKPTEIAREFGFSNYSTFYRCYRKYFKTAPFESIKSQ